MSSDFLVIPQPSLYTDQGILAGFSFLWREIFFLFLLKLVCLCLYNQLFALFHYVFKFLTP